MARVLEQAAHGDQHAVEGVAATAAASGGGGAVSRARRFDSRRRGRLGRSFRRRGLLGGISAANAASTAAALTSPAPNRLAVARRLSADDAHAALGPLVLLVGAVSVGTPPPRHGRSQPPASSLLRFSAAPPPAPAARASLRLRLHLQRIQHENAKGVLDLGAAGLEATAAIATRADLELRGTRRKPAAQCALAKHVVHRPLHVGIWRALPITYSPRAHAVDEVDQIRGAV